MNSITIWLRDLVRDIAKGIVGGVMLCAILAVIFLLIVSFDIPDKTGLAEGLMEFYNRFEI